MERVHEALLRVSLGRHVQVVEDRAEELVGGERGVEDERGVGVGPELREEVAGERRLAGAHLAGDQDEAAALAPAELEVGEGLGVPVGEVEVLRVGSEVEGLLAEAVPGLVHGRGTRSASAAGRVYHPPREAAVRGMLALRRMQELRVPGVEASASLHGRGTTVVVLGHGAGGNRRTPDAGGPRRGARRPPAAPPSSTTSPTPRGAGAARTRRPCSRPRPGPRPRSPWRRPAPGGSCTAAARWAGGSPPRSSRPGQPRRRPRLPRLPAAPPRAVREAARGAPAEDRGADAVRPGHPGRVRARGPAPRPDGAARCPARSSHRVAEADHSFGVLKRSGRTPEDVLAEVAGRLLAWLDRHGL